MMPANNGRSQDCCRLCGFPVDKRLSLRVLDKYDVDYLVCQNCESLQTSTPFWLSETYSGLLPNLDFGAARRALRSCAVVLLASKTLAMSRSSQLLDFGGGDGFVCRSLKDVGFRAFVYDKFATNTYADGFRGNPDEQYDIVCAFEVWEHLERPNEEIERLFSKRPKLVIVSTELYEGQGSDWGYLGPGQGGHVFFYSKQAMSLIASKYGYDLLQRDSTVIFSRSTIPFWRRFSLTCALSPGGLLLGRLWIQAIRPHREA